MKKHIFKIILLISALFAILPILMGASVSKVSILSLNQLPETTATYDQSLRKQKGDGEIGKAKINKAGKTFSIEVEYKNKTYQMHDLKLPYSENALDEFYGSYWTEEVEGQVNRFLVYFLNGTNKNLDKIRKNLEDKKIEQFQIMTFWNLTTGDHYTQNKVRTYGIITEESTGVYYLDLAIDVPNDDLLYINLNYDYTERFWFSKKSGTVKNYAVRKGDKAEVHTHAPTWLKAWTTLGGGLLAPVLALVETETHVVDKMQKLVFDETTKDQYIEAFNTQLSRAHDKGKNLDLNSLTKDKLISENYYRIYLREFSSFFSRGIEFNNIVINDIVYVYQGKTYHVGIENIWQYVPDYYAPPTFENQIMDGLQTLGANLKWFFGKYKWYLAGAGIIAILAMLIYLFGPAIRGGSEIAGESLRKFNENRKKKNKRKK